MTANRLAARVALALAMSCAAVPTQQPPAQSPRGKLAPLDRRANPVDEADLNERVTPEVKAVRRAENSVVSIYVLTRDRMEARMRGTPVEGQGSGVIVDQNGLLITNWHVVAFAAANPNHYQVRVKLRNKRDYPARILNVSREHDLALLQLELPAGDEVKPVAIGDSDSLMVGETVIAIGNPQGHANTVTRGVLSATDREIVARTPDNGALKLSGLLQTDAAINQGNSGGALLDITGKLIGINNAMAANAENIGFAIPVNTVQRVFQDLLVGSASYTTWLGLRVAQGDDGLRVTAVDDLGPAAEAGVRVGDVLVAAGEQAVGNAVEYARALVGAQPGRAFALRLRRGGREVAVRPVPQPASSGVIARAIGAQVEEATDSDTLRSASQAFSAGLRRQYRLPSALRVARVSEGGPAAELGLRAGDVLLYWEQRPGWREPFDGLEGLANLLVAARGRGLRIALLRDGEVYDGPLSVR